MATIEELQNALVKADAAGDAAGAKMLADHIRSIQPESNANALPSDDHQLGGFGNLVYGAAKGAADLVQAPAQLAINAAGSVANKVAPDSTASQFLNEKANQFNQYLTNQENQYQQETPGSIPAGVGRFASNVIPFALTGGQSAAPAAAGLGGKALSLAKVLGQSAGLTALTQPVNNATTDTFMADKALQAAIGGAGGVMGAGLGGLAGKVISPKISPEAAAAMKEGITPTVGQLYGGALGKLENASTSLPFIGNMIKDAQRGTTMDINRAAYNRALNPIGQNADNLPIGNAGIGEIKGKLSDAYNALLPKLTFKGDQQFGADLNKIVTMANDGSVPPQVSGQFNSILKNHVLNRMTPDGKMSGETLKLIEQDIGNKASGFSKSLDPNQQQLGSALNEVLGSIRSTLARSNPEYAKELADINKGYANYAILRGAAKSPATENGVFTPAQLARAVYAQDRSVGKGRSASGTALMQDLAQTGKSVAPTFPNSGTADRLGVPALIGGMIGAPVQTIAGLGAGLVGSLPYTNAGKKLAATILARRPEGAPALANATRKAALPLGAVLGAYTPQLFNGGQ